MRSVCGLICSSICLTLLSGCWGGGPSRVEPPEVNPSSAAAAAMKQYDKNGDGKIAGDELTEFKSINSVLTLVAKNPSQYPDKPVDKDGDGAVSEDEIAGTIQRWLDSRTGRTTININVTSASGAPVEGAQVRFVPEKFLGSSFLPAEGTTDKSGACTVNSNDPNEPGLDGIAPGLYVVEISKGGKTQTFGALVAIEAPQSNTGYNFVLK